MQVGFAVSDITPELGIYLTGYGRPERTATGVHSPLNATAMVIKDGNTEVAVVSLDWCFISWELTCKIRKEVEAAAGIPGDNVLLCCTHTHSAPHTTDARTLGRVAVDPENKGAAYAQNSVPKIVDAICRAKNSLREAAAGFVAGKTKTGVSRRSMTEDGKVNGFLADPDAMYDDNMTVARFIDCETKEDLGIFVHCSAHNTAMGADRNISSDWCGVMRKRMGDRFKAPIIFINGAIGDVGPRTNRWMEYSYLCGYSAGGGDGAPSAEEVGYRAASDALELLELIKDFRADLPLKAKTVTITVPQEIPMSESEAREILAKYENTDTNVVEPPVEYQIAKVAVETWQKPPQPEFSFDQTVIALGPLAFAPYPFEMFSIFSLRLRKFGPFEYTLLTSNTNGRNAYLPDRGAIVTGGYESTVRKTVRPYVLKPEAGDLAVVQTLEALRSL